MREVTWRFWAIVLAVLGGYGALGWWWSSNGTVEEWIYRIGLTAATVLPLIFTAVYSTRAKWWKNDIGTSIVLAILSIVPTAFPLMYAFWADGGMITASWLGWLEVFGPCLSALALAGASYVWLRTAKGKNTPGGTTPS